MPANSLIIDGVDFDRIWKSTPLQTASLSDLWSFYLHTNTHERKKTEPILQARSSGSMLFPFIVSFSRYHIIVKCFIFLDELSYKSIRFITQVNNAIST